MFTSSKLRRAVVCEGQADEGQVNDHLPSALSGDPEGVTDGFALGEEFKAAKVEGQIGHEAGS